MKEEMTKLDDNTGKRKLLIITAETGDVSRTPPLFSRLRVRPNVNVGNIRPCR